jgi:hypothetical protein
VNVYRDLKAVLQVLKGHGNPRWIHSGRESVLTREICRSRQGRGVCDARRSDLLIFVRMDQDPERESVRSVLWGWGVSGDCYQ